MCIEVHFWMPSASLLFGMLSIIVGSRDSYQKKLESFLMYKDQQKQGYVELVIILGFFLLLILTLDG